MVICRGFRSVFFPAFPYCPRRRTSEGSGVEPLGDSRMIDVNRSAGCIGAKTAIRCAGQIRVAGRGARTVTGVPEFTLHVPLSCQSPNIVLNGDPSEKNGLFVPNGSS